MKRPSMQILGKADKGGFWSAMVCPLMTHISLGDDFNSGRKKSLFSGEDSLFGQNNSLFR